MYIPGTALSAKTMKMYDLRTTMLLGGSLTTVGCAIRWIGGYARDSGHMSPIMSYTFVLIGTVVVASSQPFYLNMPAKIAASWFAVKERDIATTLCSLANPLGSALGSLLPAMFVSGEGSDVKGVSTLLVIQLFVAAIALTLTWLFFKSSPPSPPSNSAFQMDENRKNDGEENTHVMEDVKKLLANRQYVMLLIGFTVALGATSSHEVSAPEANL
jgi:Na+/melibiose symporter-like transporter